MDQYVGSRANGRYTSNATYAWIATSINHTLFDSDVQNWIVYAIRNVLNPSGGGGGYNVSYAFFLPQGTDLCFNGGGAGNCYCPDNNCGAGNSFGFCAYHELFDTTDKNGAPIHVIYQAMPYQNVNDPGVGGCQITNGPQGVVTNSTLNVFSHELSETFTDPDPFTGYNSASGEIGDLCAWNEDNPIMLNTVQYSIQREWSNAVPNQTYINNTSPGCVGYYPMVSTHDLNYDTASDLVWRDGSGDLVGWLMNGATVQSGASMGFVSTVWSVVGQRDFNGDGSADLLWRDSSGNMAMWFMNGTSVVSSAGLGSVGTAWSVVATADFNGDGKGDILWRDTSGNLAMWLMNGSGVVSSVALGNVPTNWIVAGTGDFNNDGKADILWRDTTGGNVAIWFMNGTTISSTGSVGFVPTIWSIVATGDFNGDQMSDIVWRDTSGNLAIWLMNGASVLSSAGLGGVSTAWSIIDTGDYNYDGKSDLLWYNSGSTAIWMMNGTSVITSASVGYVSPVWSIQGRNAD